VDDIVGLTGHEMEGGDNVSTVNPQDKQSMKKRKICYVLVPPPPSYVKRFKAKQNASSELQDSGMIISHRTHLYWTKSVICKSGILVPQPVKGLLQVSAQLPT
jgi:hypothetical protein